MTTEEQNLDQFVISEVAFVAPGQDDSMAFTTDFGNLDYVSLTCTCCCWYLSGRGGG